MPFQRFDRHARLVTSMADALGHDIETAMLSGRLSAAEYREKVMRCTGCANAAACEALLEEAGGHLDTAPGYCRNRDYFAAVTG